MTGPPPAPAPAAAAPATRRLFLALWPDEAARAAIAAWRDAWSWPPGARLVAPDQWHLTLHFLGAVPTARIPSLADALAIEAAPCAVLLGQPATWHGGIAVLGTDEIADGLAALRARLADVLRDAGLAVEVRPWRPHVTLARRAAGGVAPDPRSPGLDAVRWTAERHALVVSEGGRYRTLRDYALGGIRSRSTAASSAAARPPTR